MKHIIVLFEIFKYAIIVKFLCCFCTCQSFSILVLFDAERYEVGDILFPFIHTLFLFRP